MFRFCSLGSGSSGNATLIEAHTGQRPVRVLVDCGMSLRELTRRLAERGCIPSELDAVFVTHEHGDHIGCVTALMRKHCVPVWMSEGTWAGFAREHATPPGVNWARHGEPVTVASHLRILPFAVPHDAREPLQLTVDDGAHRLGILTDAGIDTAQMVQALQSCTALLLECNHDAQMLANGPYPYVLKQRIAGPRGHLSNDTAARILGHCKHAGLRHVVAAHLSEQNNRPELAALSLARVLGTSSEDVVVADAAYGTRWLDLH